MCAGILLALLGVALYQVISGEEEEGEEGDGTKVGKPIKRQLLKAERALRSGDYPKAEKACHSALGLLMKSRHAENKVYLEARAVTMDKLANIYLEQRKWKEAEMLFKETLRIMLHVGTPEDDDAVLEISLKLSKICHNEKRYDEAEVGFNWCVENAQKKWKLDQSIERYAFLGMCLLARAQFYQLLGQHVPSIKDFREIVDIAEVMYGPHHLQVAVSYSNLATALDASKDYAGAVELVHKGLEILQHLQSTPEPGEDYDASTVEYYTGVLQANLGTIHLNNGKEELAAVAYGEAEKAARKHGDKQLLHTITQGRLKMKEQHSKV